MRHKNYYNFSQNNVYAGIAIYFFIKKLFSGIGMGIINMGVLNEGGSIIRKLPVFHVGNRVRYIVSRHLAFFISYPKIPSYYKWRKRHISHLIFSTQFIIKHACMHILISKVCSTLHNLGYTVPIIIVILLYLVTSWLNDHSDYDEIGWNHSI